MLYCLCWRLYLFCCCVRLGRRRSRSRNDSPRRNISPQHHDFTRRHDSPQRHDSMRRHDSPQHHDSTRRHEFPRRRDHRRLSSQRYASPSTHRHSSDWRRRSTNRTRRTRSRSPVRSRLRSHWSSRSCSRSRTPVGQQSSLQPTNDLRSRLSVKSHSPAKSRSKSPRSKMIPVVSSEPFANQGTVLLDRCVCV